MQIPRKFTITPASQRGDVYGTEFVLRSTLAGEYNAFAWDLGDGNIVYDQEVVTHSYNYPGIYPVSLSAWTDYGKLYTDEASINVDFVYRDALEFSSVPDVFNDPGLRSIAPFVVSVTSSKINQPLSVILQTYNSKSIPYYAVPSKWRFITPTWKFSDINENVIEDGVLKLNTTPIYKNGKIVATKGEASFYFTDDLSSGVDPTVSCPLIFSATLSTESFTYPKESLIYPYASYSNNEYTRAVLPWQIRDIIPTKLKVTENFINDVYPIKWAEVPIPIMITPESDTSLLDSYEGDSVIVSTALSYPTSNEIGALHPVILTLSSNRIHESLSGVLTNGVHFSADETYFRAFDEYGNVASGYVFTTITPLTGLFNAIEPGSTCVVLASTIATNSLDEGQSFKFPLGYPIRSNVYVSHPLQCNVNKIGVQSYAKACQTSSYYQQEGLIAENADISLLITQALSTTNVQQSTLSGYSAVYGLAYDPIANKVYTTDADQSLINLYSSTNELLTSIQMSAIFGSEVLAPSHLTIDRRHNVWVSLYDDHRIAKFDQNLNYLLSGAPFTYTGPTSAVSFVSPPVLETTRQNEVWVAYADAENSLLVKYDRLGRPAAQATALPGNSIPISLSIDAGDNVWVACKGTDTLMRFDTHGNLLQSVSGVLVPSYIALDRSSNIWIAHGVNLCSLYDVKTHQLSTWKFFIKKDEVTSSFGSSGSSTSKTKVLSSIYLPEGYTEQDIQDTYIKDEIWGGLATDVYNRVWVIDSDNNVVSVFKVEDPTELVSVPLIPPIERAYVIQNNDTFVSTVSAVAGRSAQASGDWTGNKWYQKYAGVFDTIPVRGVSAPFVVNDIYNTVNIAKVNDTFDCAGYFKSLALPEVLSRNTELFDNFFKAVVGDGDPTRESAGRVIYERIANFVANHADFETAEVEQLMSIAKSMSLEVSDYGKGFPTAVNDLINLFSIPKEKLRGVPKLEADINNNIGPLLTKTSLVTAYNYYFVRDKKYDVYQLIYANESNLPELSANPKVYPLSSIEIAGFRQPYLDNYYFFEYNPENVTGYVGNLIDWNSKHTTISYNLSTNEDWYGDGGIIETMFNNLLTKQLYSE